MKTHIILVFMKEDGFQHLDFENGILDIISQF